MTVLENGYLLTLLSARHSYYLVIKMKNVFGFVVGHGGFPVVECLERGLYEVRFLKFLS
jgi:hypothetical protein